jgi:hypothetical protein
VLVTTLETLDLLCGDGGQGCDRGDGEGQGQGQARTHLPMLLSVGRVVIHTSTLNCEQFEVVEGKGSGQGGGDCGVWEGTQVRNATQVLYICICICIYIYMGGDAGRQRYRSI